MSVGPEYFSALNPNFLLQIVTILLSYAPQQVTIVYLFITDKDKDKNSIYIVPITILS